MYRLHVVNTEGPDAGLAGLHPEVLAEFADLVDAVVAAERDGTLYDRGVAIVDTERRVIDWGAHPETGDDLETDYDGNPISYE